MGHNFVPLTCLCDKDIKLHISHCTAVASNPKKHLIREQIDGDDDPHYYKPGEHILEQFASDKDLPDKYYLHDIVKLLVQVRVLAWS